MRQVIIYPGETGFYVAECPSLPGRISQGASKQEALENIKKTIQAYSEALTEQGIPIPVDTLDTMLIAI